MAFALVRFLLENMPQSRQLRRLVCVPCGLEGARRLGDEECPAVQCTDHEDRRHFDPPPPSAGSTYTLDARHQLLVRLHRQSRR
eukprot:5225232-Heterocapsa_arctica.AAC.1